ncbi:MAG: sugar ABC transporter ATP-binding protein [Anaerolineae bacterium]|nr:sugar ABC transporter ATP-binding protein [Anaerolineae bacterium]
MTPLLQIEAVSKHFPGVQALSAVSLSVLAGEVHALVGENGAGKSTLMKILAGVYVPDSGRLLWQGRPVTLHHPAQAQRLGISIIYQEFNLLPDLTVAENILLNHEPRTRLGLLDWPALNRRTRDLLALLETDIDPEEPVSGLSVAQQQMVEIVKALAVESRLIIMDEPTATLNPVEVQHLFQVIDRLKSRGSAVIFISHRLDEVLAIAQRVTVLKDGRWIATQPAAGLTQAEIVRQMVGRSLEDIFPPRQPAPAAAPLLEVRGLHSDRLRDISFTLRPGEIVGCVGLEGHGQRELARALFGLERLTGGSLHLGGAPLRLRHPRSAIEAGIVFISDDRKAEGLALKLGVRENVALPNLKLFNRGGIITPVQERDRVAEIVAALGVKTPALDQEVRLLSGGNQQKTVLAKWLLRAPRLLVFVEPTRGIDIGAKLEIYQLIHRLAAGGAGVLVVSSELLEVLGLSHRVLVLREGALQADWPIADCTEENIMRAATGVQA